MTKINRAQNQAGTGQEKEQNQGNLSGKAQEEKFPDMDNLTEEDKKKWFTIEVVGGYKFLKVKPEMFTPPKVEGPAVFLGKVTTYKKGEQGSTVLAFDKDF